METREFHLGDVLSITTGRLVSLRGMEGIYDILNFMTGDNLFTHQLPRAMEECQPFLDGQYPEIAEKKMERDLVLLDAMLAKARAEGESKTKDKAAVAKWVKIQVAKHGKMLTVTPILSGAHKVKNPIQEMIEMKEMMGGDASDVIVAIH